MNPTLPEPLASASFTAEQKEYLAGLFAGVAAGGQRFSDVEPAPATKNEYLIFEERVKRELHPLDIERGCQTDRKKARLKHLLEKMPLDEYLAEVEKKLGKPLRRSAYDPAQMRWASQELPHSHIGDFPQKQRGLNYVGVAVVVGQMTPKQMLRIAELADSYGSGEIRLTVWQNFIIPNVPDAFVPTLTRALEKIGFCTKQSNIASGVIACTGNSYCKYAQSNTKGHAVELIKYLEKRMTLDQPVNIHLTGCPNSCAQHYIGDIGCLGVKAKVGGETVDGSTFSWAAVLAGTRRWGVRFSPA